MAPVGRPTKYTDDVPQKLRDYINGGYLLLGHAIPSVVGFACHVGVHKQTLQDWAKDPEHEDFSTTFALLGMHQENTLLNGGLKNELNPTITKLALSNHGYSDSTKNQNTEQYLDKDGKPTDPPSFLAAIADLNARNAGKLPNDK